jgi:LmbE family N-acetylglucosaminyl deacetylase
VLARDVKRTLTELPFRNFADIVGSAPFLVLAPHPDDESLGCGGLIAEACIIGHPVHVVILTDGRRSHPNSRTWAAPRLAQLRQNEARAAAAALGLPPDRLTFLGVPDGEAPHRGSAFDALAARIAEMMEVCGARTVFATWRQDPHGDHGAAAKLAEEACRRTGARHLAYPVWAWTLEDSYEMEGSPRGFRLDITRILPLKRRAIAAHASQMSPLIDDDPTGFFMAAEMRALFERPWEVFVEP